MSIIFPNSNLPTSSQPWAREVTKQLSNIIASSTSSQINNAARDNQLNSSIIALNAVVNDVSVVAQEAAAAALAAQNAADTANAAANTANTAINGLLGLGTTGSGYTINVSNITSGGARDGVLTITSGSNSSIQLFNGGIDLNGPAAQVRVGTAGNGGTTVEGAFRVNANIRAQGITSTAFLQAENHAGGGTTGASINNNGTIIRTTSSERYKQDIQSLQVDYEELLSLEPKRFRLKDEVAENKNARFYAGFIAEEINNTSLKDFVAYRIMEDGSVLPDGVYYGELTAALLTAIKYQNELIESLGVRIEILEKGA